MIAAFLATLTAAAAGGQPVLATTHDFVVQAAQCQPNAMTTRWVQANFAFFGTDTSTAGIVTCPVSIPDNARVLAMECAIFDAAVNGDVLVEFVDQRVDAGTGAPATGSLVVSVSSSGSAGYQMASAALATPVTLRRRNGNERSVFTLVVSLPAATTAEAAFRDCAIVFDGVPFGPPTATLTDDVVR